MKTKLFYFLFFSFLLIFSSSFLKAEDFVQRKGFFLSFAPGFGPEVIEYKHLGGGTNLRLGAGITNRVMLYGEGDFFYTTAGDINYFVGDLQPKVQYYIHEQFYANYGFGISIGNLNTSDEAETTKAGFMTSAGFGYEFKWEKKFRLAPEVGLYYRRMGGINYFVPMAMVNLLWYFYK